MNNFSAKYLPVIQKFYTNAMDIDKLTYRLFSVIESELGIKPHQIIHADSICSDDVNNIEYPEHARIMLGPFNLGGLCGFPFCGITGISAFAHHVPEDGAVLVYFGPHVGMTKDGDIGKLYRMGQSKLTSCCGAALAALQKLLKNEITENEITNLDYQQNIIEQILLMKEDRIKSAANPIFETTEVLFEAIETRVNDLIINSDFDVGSYFECRTFKIIDSDTFESKDVLSQIYK